jgi:hypothetical protein
MVIDGFEGEGRGMGGSKNKMFIYKNNLPSIYLYKRIKIAPKLLHIGFFDDFRSKNGLPASDM